MKKQAILILAALLAGGSAYAADQTVKGNIVTPQNTQQQNQQRQQQEGGAFGTGTIGGGQSGQLFDVGITESGGPPSQAAQRLDFKAANNLNGMPIMNGQGEQVGEVDKVLVDMNRGQLAYVLMTRGGIWGIGEDKYIVPWNAIKTNVQGQALVLQVPVNKLRAAPRGGEIQYYLTQQMGREISQHYGVAPYWESSGQQQNQQNQQQQMQQQQPRQQQMPQQQGTQQNRY